MNKNFSKIYTIVVLIALILLGAWSAWDVYQLRSDNTATAQLNTEKIKNIVESNYNSGMPFNDSDFFNVIRSLFSENQELEILTIYSHDTGIKYYYNRGEDATLLNQDDNNPLTWESLPEYKYNQLMKTKLNSSLNAADRTGLAMDLIYQVVDRSEVYNILIRVLIVVVVLFFTTLFMIFTVSRKRVTQVVIDENQPDFDQSSLDEDEMSLDWNENEFVSGETETTETPESAFDDDFSIPPIDDVSSDFDDINLDDDTGSDLGDLSLDDDTSSDFGDLSLDDDTSSDFGDLSLDDDSSSDFDDLSLDDDSSSDFGDISLDGSESDSDFSDLNLDDTDSDFGDLNLGDDEMDSDMTFDDIETDIPEEEDLMAMDHEVSPTTEIDDFDFDNIGDTFSDEIENQPQSLYSPKSGVGWEDFIEERVNLELERAASFDQDLVLGVIQCTSLTEDNYKIFADRIKDDFNYPDMIFEYKENGFAIIVPNTDLNAALQTLESFTGKEQSEYGEINVGISSRNGRLITGSRIFKEAENALHKAIDDTDKNIVGFRSDPDKFRDYLSNKS